MKLMGVMAGSQLKMANLHEVLFTPVSFTKCVNYSVKNVGFGKKGVSGHRRFLEFISNNGDKYASAAIYFEDTAFDARQELFVGFAQTALPVEHFSVTYLFVKDGPGDLCLVERLGVTDTNEPIPGKFSIKFSRGNVSVYLRSNDKSRDLLPLAREMDAMIVAAMAKAEAAEKAAKEKAGAAGQPAGQLEPKAPTGGATKAEEERRQPAAEPDKR